MSSTKLHSSLPAPIVHTSHLSTSNSKSHVLAGVQDAYWSDDETEDAECPLCLEEMDVSDLNFKPCPCGYQVCRFCWHHIKENLNGRCPACRREYSDDAVQFKPIAKEDHKRLTQQKKQRDRERKEIDALGRRQLVNVRVVQRNVVYVVGLGSRFAKEELIPTLRSHEYFGQYGKISKILLVKRTTPGARTPVVGLYITYHRREDAARAIAAVDGSPSPGGGQEVMRASHGTTKYCMAFLRSVACTNNGCMDLHEWGDEKDCFTKEDLTTLKHTMKDTENRQRANVYGKKLEEADNSGLPRAAGWGNKGTALATTAQSSNNGASSNGHHSRESYRATRRGNRTTRTGGNISDTRAHASSVRAQQQERRSTTSTKTPSQASSSRPTTPAVPSAIPQRPSTPATASSKPSTVQKEAQFIVPPRSPASSFAVESDLGSGSQDAGLASPVVQPASSANPITPSAPPGLPTAPPGLTTIPPPPGIPSSAAMMRDPSSNPSYQMSTQARALLDDVRARRETLPPSSTSGPFPDFDRTLQNLTGSNGEYGGFNFNLDPKLAGDNDQANASLPEMGIEAGSTFSGNYVDPFIGANQAAQVSGPQQFPSFAAMSPPGLSGPSNQARQPYNPPIIAASGMERQTSTGSSYTGSFNPFSESNEDHPSSPGRRPPSSAEDESGRRVSRFGFARERQGSGFSATSSPLHSADASLYSASENLPSATSSHTPWPFQRHYEFGPPPGIPLRTSTPGSVRNSPLVPHAMAQPGYPSHQQSRFHPFDTGVNEPSKEFIGVSRERVASGRPAPSDLQQGFHSYSNQRFQDPAIMSSIPYGINSHSENGFALPTSVGGNFSPSLSYGPPPGLTTAAHRQVQTPSNAPNTNNRSQPHPHSHASGQWIDNLGAMSISNEPHASHSTHASPAASPVLSPADFPALPTQSVELLTRSEQPPQFPVSRSQSNDEDKQARLQRKAAKKLAAAERAAEKERIGLERAAERDRIAKKKAAERAKVMKDKADEEIRLGKERERIAKNKAAEKVRVAKEKAEKDKMAQEKAEKEKEKAANVADTAINAKGKVPVRHANMGLPSSSLSSPTVKSAPRIAGVKTLSNVDATPGPGLQVPILSKMPKKNKPATKPIKIPKDEDSAHETLPNLSSVATMNSETEHQITRVQNVSEVVQTDRSTAKGSDILISPTEPTPLDELLEQIDVSSGVINIVKHPFFDLYKINPAAKMPLEYGPLVHALSALSVGGGSFANNMPTGSIDNAVSSFQQLLETLTQTISDLLRLLPRTTWDDSSSFDGVLRDMLKGDDFLDETGDDGNGRDDEVAALTLALERRARWMEVQLAKLEELHRDINTAAVRAVLAFNDRGWDASGFLPRVGNTLARFDHLGLVEEQGSTRPMNIAELEKRLAVAKEAMVFAETEVREGMRDLQTLLPVYED